MRKAFISVGRGVSRSRKEALAGDTARQASSPEVKGLCREANDLKEAVTELTLENHLVKKL
ncbi:MAG: hypothetical protein DHS20C04_08950 [Hyphococcus sp.]|nr:MAG: hypothetical protein DHS20C04_08950 [Marinicaulis sp.]